MDINCTYFKLIMKHIYVPRSEIRFCVFKNIHTAIKIILHIF